ncbi:hypothetical protein ABHA59_15655, partial [Clostridium tertium]
MQDNRYLFDNYINIARNFVTEKEYVKALKFYKKAYRFEQGRKDIELILDIALLYDKLGYKDLSEEKYREAILIEEKDARAYYGLGVLCDEDGFLEHAIEYYKTAINLDNNYDRAYFYLANAYD